MSDQDQVILMALYNHIDGILFPEAPPVILNPQIIENQILNLTTKVTKIENRQALLSRSLV